MRRNRLLTEVWCRHKTAPSSSTAISPVRIRLSPWTSSRELGDAGLHHTPSRGAVATPRAVGPTKIPLRKGPFAPRNPSLEPSRRAGNAVSIVRRSDCARYRRAVPARIGDLGANKYPRGSVKAVRRSQKKRPCGSPRTKPSPSRATVHPTSRDSKRSIGRLPVTLFAEARPVRAL